MFEVSKRGGIVVFGFHDHADCSFVNDVEVLCQNMVLLPLRKIVNAQVSRRFEQAERI